MAVFVRAVREDPKKRGDCSTREPRTVCMFLQTMSGVEVAQVESADHAGARSGG